MTQWLAFFVAFMIRTCRSRASLQLEVAALRHQLTIYKEQGRRPRIRPADRLLWSLNLALVVRVEEGAVFCSATDGARVAEEAIPGLLAKFESRGQARPAENCA